MPTKQPRKLICLQKFIIPESNLPVTYWVFLKGSEIKKYLHRPGFKEGFSSSVFTSLQINGKLVKMFCRDWAMSTHRWKQNRSDGKPRINKSVHKLYWRMLSVIYPHKIIPLLCISLFLFTLKGFCLSSLDQFEITGIKKQHLLWQCCSMNRVDQHFKWFLYVISDTAAQQQISHLSWQNHHNKVLWFIM